MRADDAQKAIFKKFTCSGPIVCREKSIKSSYMEGDDAENFFLKKFTC